MTSIGIVGTGISGLTLALTLQQAGIATTIYAERGADDMRRERLSNTATCFGPTIARELALGIEPRSELASYDVFHVSTPSTPISFTGHLRQPASAVDFRVHLPRLLEVYATRGGDIVIGPMSPEQVIAATGDHDLIVVASGRESVNAFFPRDAERSPFSAPARRLCAMLCLGVSPAEPVGTSASLVPGVGEVFEFPWLSPHGLVSGILIEALPGGPLEEITRIARERDQHAFESLAIDLLRRYAPSVYQRIDQSTFALTGPLDVLQGALVPTVRRPYHELAPGRFALAIGDAYVTNDPICAQGANLGSACAAVTAHAICRDVAYDDLFCRDLERKLWTLAEPATHFTNTFLMPPPHLELILAAANDHQEIADTFIDLLADPDAAWRALATPERAAGFLAEASAATGARAPMDV